MLLRGFTARRGVGCIILGDGQFERPIRVRGARCRASPPHNSAVFADIEKQTGKVKDIGGLLPGKYNMPIEFCMSCAQTLMFFD